MRQIFPNMILIAGNGRNVGKTTFARKIIGHLTESITVIGLKVSPHLHDLNNDLKLINKTSDYVIAEEKGLSSKDSSLMLQAGAKKVFLIMAKQDFLEEAFSLIAHELKDSALIVESGGLSEIVEPGLFFFIVNPEEHIKKEQYLRHDPIMVKNGKSGFDFDPKWLIYMDSKFSVIRKEK